MACLTRPAYYRGFHLRDVARPEYRHLFYLLFWLLQPLTFFGIGYHSLASFRLVHVPLDDVIPFCAPFVVPYVVWYPFVGLSLLYTVLYDVDAFRWQMRFFLVTYTVAYVAFFFWPTGQDMRPALGEGGGPFVWLLRLIYAADPPTNCCPSLHVVGSIGAALGLSDSRRFGRPLWRAGIWAMAALISVSTVFVKQHSAADVGGALVLCAAGYLLIYQLGRRLSARKAAKEG